MNNKGFTMIELVMVVLIIALLAMLTAPNIIKMVNRNKRNNYNDTIDSIIESSQLYASDNRYSLDFNDNCNGESNKNIVTTISLQQLVNSKNLSSPIINHCTNQEFNLNNISVSITLSCKTNNFTDYSVNGLSIIPNVTDEIGRINEGYFCDDVYQ